jgi:hypothetical protein
VSLKSRIFVEGIRGGGNEREQWKGIIKVCDIRCIARNFVNAAMCLHSAQQ